MKNKIYILIVSILLFVLMLSGESVIANAETVTSEILIEATTNRVLKEKNSEIKMPMASTTKILTALTVLDNADLHRVVEIKPEMTGIEGSSVYLVAGEHLTIEELLYGLMLRSGNDCAVALALSVGGSIEEFCKMMNSTAVKCGAVNSNFVNPHGLPDDNHWTTAKDLALIASKAMQNEIFREIASSKSKRISNEFQDYDRVLLNKNKMLNLYDGANGIKTGYTKKAGRCLVSAAKRDDMQLISVVLNCSDMWNVSMGLLDYGFENYKMVQVFDSERIIDNLDVVGSREKCAVMSDKDVYLPLREDEKDKLKIIYEYPEKLQSPVEFGTNCGEIKFFIENHLLFSQNIFTINNAK